MAEYNNGSMPQNAPPNAVCYAFGDVNGDGLPEEVYLTGTKVPDGELLENITLVIREPHTGRTAQVMPPEHTGYAPCLFLGDFTGDGIPEIMVSIASGGSGGIMFYYLYSYLGNRLIRIFDFERFNNSVSYEVRFRDDYRVSVRNQQNGVIYMIDLSARGRDYLSEIYDANGKLKEPIEGWVDPVSGLYPVDFDGDGVYDLLAYQRISGRYHADSLGYVLTYLRWARQGFSPYDRQVAVFGNKPAIH